MRRNIIPANIKHALFLADIQNTSSIIQFGLIRYPIPDICFHVNTDSSIGRIQFLTLLRSNWFQSSLNLTCPNIDISNSMPESR